MQCHMMQFDSLSSMVISGYYFNYILVPGQLEYTFPKSGDVEKFAYNKISFSLAIRKIYSEREVTCDQSDQKLHR